MHLQIMITAVTGDDFTSRLGPEAGPSIAKAVEEFAAALGEVTGGRLTARDWEFRSLVAQAERHGDGYRLGPPGG